ncbi:M23 family metallopeptidase [Halonatronum saccharophilum]|uniref:M23 family metallopeptidase n=1 Tax=Halonatronum saccharophilum TaxID=150060 RepID=UPI0004B8843D|nr:M23 family metallopeptidase [Halonatronum saccharophilum]
MSNYYKEKNKITFKIVPRNQNNIKTYNISKGLIKLCLTLILVAIVSLVGSLAYFYREHSISLDMINNLEDIRYKNNSISQENEFLKEQLFELTGEIEKVRDQFGDVITENQQIKELIELNDQISMSDFKNNMEQNVGYYTFDDPENSTVDLIKYAQANLDMLNEILPKQRQNLNQLREEVVEYGNYLEAKPRGWPVRGGEGRITSGFGDRLHPVLQREVFHSGIDIGIWYNHKIIATGSGKVVLSRNHGGYGRTVIIDHGYGYRTLYAHNNRLLVEVGDKVERGDVIALSGNSGRSTGPHLHYEVQYNGDPVNPREYIN